MDNRPVSSKDPVSLKEGLAEGASEESTRIPPETVSVPEGRLRQGSEGGASAVAVPAFRLGRTPVTNGQYAVFLATGAVGPPPWWQAPGFTSPRQPVVGVTWSDAMTFCGWLSRADGGAWRLPTEREWEFAACGGLVAPQSAWGPEPPAGEIPEGPLAAPWETGRGVPNGYGLCDMGTIVHEWCLDWRDPADLPDRYPGRPPRRASRGGSWRHTIRWSSPSARSSLPPDYRYSDFGFRVLREADP